MNKSELIRLRDRWRRWLGQKTREDKPYWTTLLDGNWSSWARKVLEDRTTSPIYPLQHLSHLMSRLEVKTLFGRAIDNANLQDLIELDSLYIEDRIEEK